MKKEKNDCYGSCSKCFHNYATGFGGFMVGIAALITLSKSDGIIDKIDQIIEHSKVSRKILEDWKNPPARKIVDSATKNPENIKSTLENYNESGSSFYIPKNDIFAAEKVLKSDSPVSQKILAIKKYMKPSEPSKDDLENLKGTE